MIYLIYLLSADLQVRWKDELILYKACKQFNTSFGESSYIYGLLGNNPGACDLYNDEVAMNRSLTDIDQIRTREIHLVCLGGPISIFKLSVTPLKDENAAVFIHC